MPELSSGAGVQARALHIAPTFRVMTAVLR
jgi:hypothetical protein